MFQTIKQDFIRFAITNWRFFICSLVYLIWAISLFGGNFAGVLLALILYAISLLFVFSPLGELLMRLLENVRKVETKREKEYLLPLFEEVYMEAQKINSRLGRIELGVIDTMAVNACAIGKHTIAVTKGAMETFNSEELKAIMAHEIAHIVYGDTIVALYTVVGNGLFTVCVVLLRWFLTLLEMLEAMISKNNLLRLFIVLARFIFDLIIFSTMLLMNIMLAVNSRKNEYRADKYACMLGYGESLVEAFYLLEKIQLGNNSTIIQKILKRHPRITKRIERLETLLDKENAA
ncbi:MAG: M48 family metalloprotease [Oscillospiraceae bacterium]|nr:M48 family metalloprotease [Oscillospiraceae bacterium]